MTDSHTALGLSTVIVQLLGVSLLERRSLVIVGEQRKGLSAAVHCDNSTFYISIFTGWIVFQGMQCGLTAAIVTSAHRIILNYFWLSPEDMNNPTISPLTMEISLPAHNGVSP